MNIEEFLQKRQKVHKQEPAEEKPVEEAEVQETTEETQIDLDVQKAVVESLAADKAVQDEKISALVSENEALKKENADLRLKMLSVHGDEEKLQKEIEKLKGKLAEQVEALNRVGDVLEANALTNTANQIALLDRDIDLPDRFPGETRDHVLEAIKEARDAAEKEGRERHAQILESVLVANEPMGNLAKHRAALEKLFKDNQNILSGPVLEELQKLGISHKRGEEYLLPAEIVRRSY